MRSPVDKFILNLRPPRSTIVFFSPLTIFSAGFLIHFSLWRLSAARRNLCCPLRSSAATSLPLEAIWKPLGFPASALLESLSPPMRFQGFAPVWRLLCSSPG
jgi:hypothetical protein